MKSPKGIIPVLILFLGFVLIFIKLGDRKLWVDECVSAYLSNNVIKYGYPSVYDGAYYKSVANGNDSNSDGVEAWYSWLTIYLQGIFRYLFGTSEFVTRLPTAILGWLSMLYLFLGIKKLTENEFIQNLTLAIYVFSIPLLIYMRSAHYYSAVLCFTTMSLFYYLSLIERPEKKVNTIMFALSLTLLFHSNYFLFIIPTTSYLVHAAIVARKKTVWIKILIAYTATFLLTTPWFLYIGMTTQGTKWEFYWA
ncbi:MAG: hypothetical protein HC831_12350 [Chloroflexia bacterium]|nr:hypothetical protein [Chloroflexia bacterium]